MSTESAKRSQLERFAFECSGPAVAEDAPGKEAEAGDAQASSMQADAAWRGRRQAGRGRQTRIAPGFTLVEIVVATVLIGLAMAAMMVSVGSNTRVNAAGTKLTQASFLAQEIREWTLSLPFRDPDPGDRNNPPGSDGTSPQTWVDDIDDLMNVTYCPPRDGQGYAISSLPQWSQTITMTWRNPANLSGTVAPGSSEIIYVNVDVKYRNNLIASSGWLVAKRPDE